MAAIAPTTGLLSNLTYDSRTLIDRAYGLCKIRPQQIQGEMVMIAQTALDMILKDLLNDAAPLWTVTKQLITLNQGQSDYGFPLGTNDVKSMYYRTMSNITPATVINTSQAYQVDFGAGNTGAPTSWSIDWGSPPTPINVTFQHSADGVTWYTLNATVPALPTIDEVQWYDMDGIVPDRFWQFIPTNSQQLLSLASASVYSTPNDILMARLNEDQYMGMTNKTQQGRPLQYWFDRAIQPIAHVWQAPDFGNAQNVMVARTQRYLFDVGNLDQSVELPARWFLAIMYALGAELAWQTPEVDGSLIPLLKAEAANKMSRAWLEERDKSPTKFDIELSAYTR